MLVVLDCTFGYLKQRIITWREEIESREMWTFQKLSMEKMLNDQFDPVFRSIQFQVQKDSTVHYLSGINEVFSSFCSSPSAPSPSHYYIPSPLEVSSAATVTFDFVVYARAAVIDSSRIDMELIIESFKYSGMAWDLRESNDVITEKYT